MRTPTPLFRKPDDAGAADCVDTPQLSPSPLAPEAPAPHTDLPEGCVDVEQVPEDLRDRALAEGNEPLALAMYGLLGVGLGVVFTQSQVISWFRIYEMFRFESFHMYGVIGTAVATAAFSVWAIQRLRLTTVHGEPIEISPKQWGGSRIPGARYWMGGVTFGLGWALLGACPGPLVALLGGGVTVMLVALLAAIAGTWTYALLRDRLPH
jgi:uncharacterized membrane protein YedE/YeeE